MDTLPPPDATLDVQQMDRGKRLATSPANSPCKEPQAKKQLWASVTSGTHNTENIPSLASVPVTDNSAERLA